MELVWKTPLASGNSSISSFNPIAYNGITAFAGVTSTTQTVQAFDVQNGQKKWELAVCNGIGDNPIGQNFMIAECENEMSVVNLDNGQLSWYYKVDGGMPRLTIINDLIYHRQGGPGLRMPYMHLVRSPLAQAQWDTVFTLYRDSIGGYTPFIESPTLWINPQGEEVLLFQNRSWNFDTSDGKIDFYAYNLSTQKVQFILEDIDPSGNSNVVTPLVDGNYAYFLGARSVSCIDLLEGNVVWQNLFYGDGAHALTSNLLIVGNKLIVKQDHDLISAFDKFSGDEEWIRGEAGFTPSHMAYHDGIIYYTADGDGKLFAVNASNGRIIWAEDSPNEGEVPASFNGGVAIDPVNRLIFVADRYYAMAFKLPER